MTPTRGLSCLRRCNILRAKEPRRTFLEATFPSRFHARAFTSHSTSAKDPTLTRSSPSSTTTALEVIKPAWLPIPADPVGTIRASLHSHRLPKWGLLIYRCDYRSDADWESFMATLHWHMSNALSIHKATDLADSLDMRVVSDQSALDGASVDRVRDAFRAWIDSAEAMEERENAPFQSPLHYPRYNYCVHVHADAVDSVVRRAPQPPKNDLWSVGYVNLVKLDKNEFCIGPDYPEEEEEAEEEEEEDDEDEDPEFGRDTNVVRAPVFGLFGLETYGELHDHNVWDFQIKQHKTNWWTNYF